MNPMSHLSGKFVCFDVRFCESSTPENVSVTALSMGVAWATASMTRFPEYWWVDRVVVKPRARRQGLGSECLRRALRLAQTQGGPREVVVAPGGYGTPLADQVAFYQSLGFDHEGDVGLWLSLGSCKLSA